MIEEKRIIYFDSDAEFEDWAVAPYATIKYKKTEIYPTHREIFPMSTKPPSKRVNVL